MMSEARLEAIVRDGLARGQKAGQIASATGVPAERVQRMMHRLNDRDPEEANRETQRDKRKELRRIYGTASAGLRAPGTLPHPGWHSKGRR
jgi:uncharacterized protein YggE